MTRTSVEETRAGRGPAGPRRAARTPASPPCRLLLPLIAAVVAPLLAQPTVAPSPEVPATARGENTGAYNVVDSFEAGYRFSAVRGDEQKYQSDVNYGNGVRLLSGSLAVNSREGHGDLFDALLLRTQGLGNDPYQYSSVHLDRNGLYRYDLTWRLNEYVNPALAIAGGQHSIHTQRRLQDHDLTLLPHKRLRLFAGYSRNSQDGPALSTLQVFDSRGDEFPVLARVRRLQNEYRVGGEIDLFGARFTALHGWTEFSETTPDTLPLPSAGNDPADRTALTAFDRAEPLHGSSPYWRLNLRKQRGRWFAGARYTYAGTTRSFSFDETALGTDRFGAARNRQTLVQGRGRRPASAGDLTVSVFPIEALTITNQTAFQNVRMDGDNAFRELNNATLATELLNFQFLGIRTVSTATELNFRAAHWISFHGGHRFASRRIRSVQGADVLGISVASRTQQDNRLNSGVLGWRLQPIKPLTLNLDAEIGRADRPFFPIAERNYHQLGARAQYKKRSLLLQASSRLRYNTNSVSLAEHSARGRDYSLGASWAPGGRLAFDANYSKLHLDTVSGLAYFADGGLVSGDRSIYISNIHAVNVSLRIAVISRADVSVGYNRVQDFGDGRSVRAAGPEGAATLPGFASAQTFPLAFESPLARLSLRLREKLTWNAGYEFYHYTERFQSQRYHAHTGYTSLTFTF